MRLDKWLFYSRFFNTRAKSSEACSSGNILVNKIKKYNSSYNVSINDIITLAKDQKVNIVKILKLPKNRISPKDTKLTYEQIK
ncbi:MAG: hypothetical protein CFH22_01263 [Alphaproteobacteria bacterium MarineAlpha5_Bin12]|nr:hypothetical protein [Pelagibacteraceae bacterium]MBG76611.1 hypothetical protein [Pelagibacteraceae bacterium]PPR40766.1 MAG: hypothetical protein CFH22_01263 [Alphaproteobacteria bacterium MarineAlpha5_Bin12]|tara:strand:+ start:2922 stop:3170 length:249 start_codon:yes stop_codon:yes gene_type:complete